MISFTWWQIISNLLYASQWTILLALITFVFGSVAALIVMFMKLSRSRVFRAVATAYIEIFQGTPLLMQLFIIYFALGLMGYHLSPMASAAIALTLWSSAFLAEIWRSAMQSVPKGQWEASSSLGMSYFEQVAVIIGPQAIRLAIAPTVGFSVQIIKSTALTSIIGFIELSRAGAMISNATFKPFEVYGYVAIIYFILCWPISYWSHALERRLNVAYSHY